jgi:hypothetical protein
MHKGASVDGCWPSVSVCARVCACVCKGTADAGLGDGSCVDVHAAHAHTQPQVEAHTCVPTPR